MVCNDVSFTYRVFRITKNNQSPRNIWLTPELMKYTVHTTRLQVVFIFHFENLVQSHLSSGD